MNSNVLKDFKFFLKHFDDLYITLRLDYETDYEKVSFILWSMMVDGNQH